jgi:DNA-binding transcriptional MocR family regulator
VVAGGGNPQCGRLAAGPKGEVTMCRTAIATFAIALSLVSAAAQAQTPMRIRGTITSLEGSVLNVKSRDGKDLKISLPENLVVVAAKAITFADIKPGDFVASTGVKDKDGKIHAVEARIFPQATPDGVPDVHLEPDEMAFPEVVDTLCDEARKPENRGYADNGDLVLKQAAARYLERVCGVTGINPETEIIHSIGSKAALSILPAALINAGDYALMTIPGYPVFGTHAKYYGGLVHNLPLTETNHFLPDLDSVPEDVLAKAKVLVLNYPNNPTGASATPASSPRARRR